MTSSFHIRLPWFEISLVVLGLILPLVPVYSRLSAYRPLLDGLLIKALTSRLPLPPLLTVGIPQPFIAMIQPVSRPVDGMAMTAPLIRGLSGI